MTLKEYLGACFKTSFFIGLVTLGMAFAPPVSPNTWSAAFIMFSITFSITAIPVFTIAGIIKLIEWVLK